MVLLVGRGAKVVLLGLDGLDQAATGCASWKSWPCSWVSALEAGASTAKNAPIQPKCSAASSGAVEMTGTFRCGRSLRRCRASARPRPPEGALSPRSFDLHKPVRKRGSYQGRPTAPANKQKARPAKAPSAPQTPPPENSTTSSHSHQQPRKQRTMLHIGASLARRSSVLGRRGWNARSLS
jgi:hypothetical protein